MYDVFGLGVVSVVGWARPAPPCGPCTSNLQGMAIESISGARMTEFFFPHVSVASSGDEYFEVSFAEIGEGEESEECDHAYFLIQRQFEDYDGGLFYIESHETKLCGHFKIIGAELARDTFRLRVACKPTETVVIRFQAGNARYNRLKRILRIIMPARILSIEEDRRSGPKAGNSGS